VDLRFVAPDLRRLDEASGEVLACGVYKDVRPFRGLAGLVDFRLAGRMSRLAKKGFLLGDIGEVVVVPVRPRLPFEKLLAYGMGPFAAFDEAAFRTVLARILDAISGLQAKSAVLELPGTTDRLVPPERTTEILFELLVDRREDELWLVEDGEGQKRIEAAAEGRHRSALRAQGLPGR
jgi:Cytosol aminopeptidase family, N-terminal domain